MEELKKQISGQVRTEMAALEEWFNQKQASTEQSLANIEKALANL